MFWYAQWASLTEELRACEHGFYVQIQVEGVMPEFIREIARGAQEAQRLLHSVFQTDGGVDHLHVVSVAHGTSLFSSCQTDCWGPLDFGPWILPVLRNRLLSLCGLGVSLHQVHESAYAVEAQYMPHRSFLLAVPDVPFTFDLSVVVFVKIAVDGFYAQGAVWTMREITCPVIQEQVGVAIPCQMGRTCICYHNNVPLGVFPTPVTTGDFVAIYRSNGIVSTGGVDSSLQSGERQSSHSSISDPEETPCVSSVTLVSDLASFFLLSKCGKVSRYPSAVLV